MQSNSITLMRSDLMKIGVLGSGLMGKETARDLVLSEGVAFVGIADVDVEKAQAVCDRFHSPKLRAFQVDATKDTELEEYMKQFDVIRSEEHTSELQSRGHL